MKELFLGKPLHWLLLVIVCAVLWYAGDLRLQLTHFDAFIVGLLAATAVCVLIVLRGYKPGERITRDEIVADETELEHGDVALGD